MDWKVATVASDDRLIRCAEPRRMLQLTPSEAGRSSRDCVLISLLRAITRVCLVVFDAQVIVLLLQSLCLALHRLQLLVLLSQLSLQLCNLIRSSFLRQLVCIFVCSLRIALILEQLVLKTECIEYEHIRTVQDDREEQSTATKVHVALRVETACLNFGSLGSKCSSSALHVVSLTPSRSMGEVL